jgi:hypothetical protein
MVRVYFTGECLNRLEGFTFHTLCLGKVNEPPIWMLYFGKSCKSVLPAVPQGGDIARLAVSMIDAISNRAAVQLPPDPE